MDQFFQTLRKIQKKERNNGTLARVEETFYQDIHNYLKELRKSAGADPFSEEYNLIKDTQRVATEICERREHKITDAAVVNIHRSYHLFTGKPKFDLVDTTPLNLTPEEEKFYFSLIDKLKEHRANISLDKLTNNQEKDKEAEKIADKPKIESATLSKSSVEKDEVLTHLDEIANAQVIENEKVEPIEKQVQKSQNQQLKETLTSPIPKKEEKPKTDDEIFDLINQEEEFVDLNKTQSKSEDLVTLLVFDEIDSIMGVDEKVYGPFHSQDIVVMPKINANIFVKNRKGRIVRV